MGRPKQGYFLDGKQIPSVTTIIGRFKQADGLIAWAYQQGVEGKDYRKTRDDAASAGTIAHEMVECDIRGKSFDASKYDESLIKRANGAYAAYLQWKEETNLKPYIIPDTNEPATEISLISKKLRCGGTIDIVLMRGLLTMSDIKTSRSIYPDYLIQIAAYKMIWEENYPHLPINGGYKILRISRQEEDDDPVSFSLHSWSDLKIAERQFVLYREAYDNDKKLSRIK